jgi:hypothetical protein
MRHYFFVVVFVVLGACNVNEEKLGNRVDTRELLPNSKESLETTIKSGDLNPKNNDKIHSVANENVIDVMDDTETGSKKHSEGEAFNELSRKKESITVENYESAAELQNTPNEEEITNILDEEEIINGEIEDEMINNADGEKAAVNSKFIFEDQLIVIDNMDRIEKHELDLQFDVYLNKSQQVSMPDLVTTELYFEEFNYQIIEDPVKGTASIVPDSGTIYYKAVEGNGSTDKLKILATRIKSEILINVSFNILNRIPQVYDVSLNTVKNSLVKVSLMATDMDDDNLIINIGEIPNGIKSFTFDPTISELSLTLLEGFMGPINLSYTANDSIDTSEPATIEINVKNQEVSGGNVAVTVIKDRSIMITLLGHDKDNDTLEYSLNLPASKGTISSFDTRAGTFLYSPPANTVGEISFLYSIFDGSSQAEGNVVVTVVNQAPVLKQATIDLQILTGLSQIFNISNLAFDPDMHHLEFKVTNPPENGILQYNNVFYNFVLLILYRIF